MTYSLKTTCTMKPHNYKKWWVSPDIIPEMIVSADSVLQALKEYQNKVENKYYMFVSNTAIKKRSPMYIDTKEGTKQVGYVITGKTEFQTNDYSRPWSTQFVDLWITIKAVSDVEF